ncbi:hypothetical protein QF042_003656 [Pedobacter sp. W3I1]|nr:hypothetical protein [Pedobacter sp. W3I1]
MDGQSHTYSDQHTTVNLKQQYSLIVNFKGYLNIDLAN